MVSQDRLNFMKKREIRYFVYSCITILVVLGFWWAVTNGLHLVNAMVFPSPVKVVQTFFEKLTDPNPDGATIPQHLFASLKLALTGYFLGVVIGVPLGLLMGWYRPVELFFRPIFDLIRPIPGIAWIPILIILLGIGLLPKAIVIFLTAFVACVENAYAGIQQTRDVHQWVGRTFGASHLELFFRIGIPTSLPLIMTGMRVALAGSWSALVAAELLASNRGLGFMIQQARGLYRPDVIIVGMLSVGLVGALLTKLLSILENIVIKGRKS